MITSSTIPAPSGLPPAAEALAAPAAETSPAWHYQSECKSGVLARAFTELHQQAHGGPVNACRRWPCADLAAAIVPGEAATERPPPPG